MSTEKARARENNCNAFTRMDCPVTETSDLSVFDFNEEDQFSAGIRRSSRKTSRSLFLGYFKHPEKEIKCRTSAKRKQSTVKLRSIAALSGKPTPRAARRRRKLSGQLHAKGPLSFECKQRAVSLGAPGEPCRSKNTCANSFCEHGNLGRFVEELPIGGEVTSRTTSGHHASENIVGLLPEGESGLLMSRDPSPKLASSDVGSCLESSPDSSHNKENIVGLRLEGESGLFVSSDPSLKSTSSDVGSCLESSLDSSHDKDVSLAEKQMEVVIIAEKVLLWGDSCVHSPRFTFATNSIKIEILEDPRLDDDWKIFQWPLEQINRIGSYSDQDAGFALLELGVSAGLQSLKRCIGMSSTSNEDGGQLLLTLKYNYGLEQLRQITALCDRYKTLWRPLQEDDLHIGMAELLGKYKIEPVPVCLNSNNLIRSEMKWTDIVYPKEDPDAVTVTLSDFQLLSPEEFVSDTIIDFYIKHLQSSLLGKQRGRFYFFNSFFFRKLTEHENHFVSGLEKGKLAFEGVKRWTAKTNLFEKDFIFVPIMQSAHWSLIIICYPGLISEENMENIGTKKSCILHLDSLEGCHTGLEEPIRNYLLEAWIQKYGYDEEVSGYKRFSHMEFVSPRVPQQTNYYDCGLFLLHYVELFIKQADQEEFPDFLTSQWFSPSHASSKRFDLQNLIIELLKESAGNQEECGSEEGVSLFESKQMCGTNDNHVTEEPIAYENSNWVEKGTSDKDLLLADPQSSDLHLESLAMKQRSGNIPLILMKCSDQGGVDLFDHEITQQVYQLLASDKCAVSSCNAVHTFHSFACSKSCLQLLERHLQPSQTDVQCADSEHMEVCKKDGLIEAACGVQLTDQQCHFCVPSGYTGFIRQIEALPCMFGERTWNSSKWTCSDNELLPSELPPDKAVCVNVNADCNRSYFMNLHCDVHAPVCQGEVFEHAFVGVHNEFITRSDNCSNHLMARTESQIEGHSQELSCNEGCMNRRCMHQLKHSEVESNPLGAPVISLIRERCMEGTEEFSDADCRGSGLFFCKLLDGTKGAGANSDGFPVENGCTEDAIGGKGLNEQTYVQMECEEGRAKSCEYFHGGFQADEGKDVPQSCVATNRHSSSQEEEQILDENTLGNEMDPNLCKIPNLADPYNISDDDDDVSQCHNSLGSGSSFCEGCDVTEGIRTFSESFTVQNSSTENALGSKGLNEQSYAQMECEEGKATSCKYFHDGVQTDETKDVLQSSVAINRHFSSQEEEKILYDNTFTKNDTDANLCKIPNLADLYNISDDDDDDVSQRYNRTRQHEDVEQIILDASLSRRHKRKQNSSSCGTHSRQVTATRPLTRSAVKKLGEKTQKSNLSGYMNRRKRLVVDLH